MSTHKTLRAGDTNTGSTGEFLRVRILALVLLLLGPIAGLAQGLLSNGFTHQGALPAGVSNFWTFTANAGDGIVVRMGKAVASSSLYPYLRLYGPNGALLDADFGPSAADVSTSATSSGTFTVVAANKEENFSNGGYGAYRITLSTTTPGSPVVVAPGDEGGSLNGTDTYDGTMNIADLDVWSFTLCAGELILLRMDELTANSSLYPYLRLYGRDGTLIKSDFGASTAQINMVATNSGTFTVVAANKEENFSNGGNGAYRLTVNGLSDDLRLCDPKISGTNVTLSGVGGVSGAEFTVLTSPLVEAPLATWSALFTNQFDLYGTFTRTNPFIRAEPNRFYILQQR
jgi:hypothetical protein